MWMKKKRVEGVRGWMKRKWTEEPSGWTKRKNKRTKTSREEYKLED